MRLVFLNSIPLGAFDQKSFLLFIMRVTPDVLARSIRECRDQITEIRCYIRHRATVDLLNRLLGLNMEPNQGLYNYRPGDILAVVTLKKPIRGAEITDVKPDDLDIALVGAIYRP